MATVDVNMLGGQYTVRVIQSDIYAAIVLSTSTPAAHLAIHFLELEHKSDNTLKSIAMLGSMSRFRGCFRWLDPAANTTTASWQASAQAPIYSATKSGVLSLA